MEEFEGAIGIDLGTTYSCVAVFHKGKVEVIPNDQGNRTTPSYVAFSDEERLIGDPARNQIIKNPKNTIYDAKRLIGRRISDKEVQNDLKTWPFEIVADDKDEAPCVIVDFKGSKQKFRPEQISGLILSKLKETAENYLGKKVTKAVITVPAYFNDAQRSSTKIAGQLAGLEVARIINEPTAAALAYGLDKLQDQKSKTILVFDLGGGTFDVSVINLVGNIFEVKATSGNTHLGGQDFDNTLVLHCIQEFKKKHGKDMSENVKAVRKLRTACEKAKRALSSSSVAEIEVDSLHDGHDLLVNISRAKFEQLNKGLFDSCIKEIERVLKEASLTKAGIDEVVMVGGSSRIPKVQELVSAYFGKPLNFSINPDEAVAFGAAIQGNVLHGSIQEKLHTDLLLLDVTPLSIGLSVDGGVFAPLIERNSTIPRKVSKTYTTAFDWQECVQIEVYEGERPRAKMNHFLGTFDLDGIRRAKAGKPNIEVTFDVDANGVLNVTAEDKDVGSKGHVRISNTNKLSNEEVQKMLQDAEKFAKEDKAHAKKLQLKSKVERYAYELMDLANTENQPDSMKDAIQDILDWLEDEGEKATLPQLESRMEKLANFHTKMGGLEGSPSKNEKDVSDKDNDSEEDADYKDNGDEDDDDDDDVDDDGSESLGDDKEKKKSKEKKPKKEKVKEKKVKEEKKSVDVKDSKKVKSEVEKKEPKARAKKVKAEAQVTTTNEEDDKSKQKKARAPPKKKPKSDSESDPAPKRKKKVIADDDDAPVKSETPSAMDEDTHSQASADVVNDI